MMTPLAMNAKVDLTDKRQDVIKGLDGVSGGLIDYTLDNIAVELPEATEGDGEHTLILGETTNIIANHIRAALNIISKQIKPITKEIETNIINCVNGNSTVETIFNMVNVRMVNIEPSFFNSTFYPKAYPNSFNGINEVKATDLLKGSYPSLSGQELLELIYADVEELQGFFENQDQIKNIYETIFVEKGWYSLFDGSSISEGVIKISNPENYSFDNFQAMVISCLITNRLVAMDDPLPGVTGVSLDDYRGSLYIARDMFTAMLVRFKELWAVRAAAGVVIIDNKAKYGKIDHGTLAGHEVITGSVTVGYNNAVLNMFAGAEDMSLSEFAIGYIYAKVLGIHIKDIITDRDAVSDAWKNYCTHVTSISSASKCELAENAARSALIAVGNNPAYEDILAAMPEDVGVTQKLLNRVTNRIDLKTLFSNQDFVNAIANKEVSLMGTALGSVLAAAFDCPIAEEILIENSRSKPGSLEHQRKMLSKAITKLIVKRLLVG